MPLPIKSRMPSHATIGGWKVGTALRNRSGVKAWAFVTTGATTRVVFTRHGTKIGADFGTLGRVDSSCAI